MVGGRQFDSQDLIYLRLPDTVFPMREKAPGPGRRHILRTVVENLASYYSLGLIIPPVAQAPRK